MREHAARTPDNKSGLIKLFESGLYEHIIAFLKSYGDKYHELEYSSNSVLHVDPKWIKQDGQFISGYIEYGHFGVPGKLVNIKTSAKHSKSKNDSDINHLYYCFYLPRNSTRGVALFHKIHGTGIKTVFENEFTNYLVKKKIYTKLSMRPITRSKVAKDYLNKTNVKKLVLERFKTAEFLGDAANQLPTGTTFDVVIRAPRGGILGTLDEFQAKKQDAKFSDNVVVANELCGKVKSQIEVDGQTRVTELANEGTESRIILTEADVKMENNFPSYSSLDKFAKKLAKELSEEMVLK
ncbi:hypothetical protein J7384_01885 [Endozoicomonas sp. G2_1]|nr:hypothetical protein [Endozoicomonas sp. G2_1]